MKIAQKCTLITLLIAFLSLFFFFSCDSDDEEEVPPVSVAKFRSKDNRTLADPTLDKAIKENFFGDNFPINLITSPVTVKKRLLTFFSDDTFTCTSTYEFTYNGSLAKASSVYSGTFVGGRDAARLEGPVNLEVQTKSFTLRNNTSSLNRNQTKLTLQVTLSKTFSSAYRSLYIDDLLEEGAMLSSDKISVNNPSDKDAKPNKSFDSTLTGLAQGVSATIADLSDTCKGSSECVVLGKKASDLVSIPLSFKYDENTRTVKVFGRLKRVTDYTGFAVNTDYQEGYFLPLLFTSSAECFAAICDGTHTPIAGKVMHLVTSNPDIKAPGKDSSAVTSATAFCDAHIVRIANADAERGADQTICVAFSDTNSFAPAAQDNYLLIDYSEVEL